MTYPWAAGEVLTAADLNAYAGLVYITSATATSGSSLAINNCFTSQFANYRIVGTMIGTSALAYNAAFRMRASGSDTATGYYWGVSRVDIFAGTINTYRGSNVTYGLFAAIAANAGVAHFVADITSPQLAAFTSFSGTATDSRSGSGYGGMSFGGTLSNTTRYDGITIGYGEFATGTISNLTVRIYGYNNG